MKALSHLTGLALEAKRLKCPTIPEFAIPKPKYCDKDANGLTNCIIDFLNIKGHYAVRINTGGIYDANIKGFRTSNTRLGTADIIASINGRHVSIEVKINKDKQSPYQLDTQKDIEKDGGIYFVARSFQSFFDFYQTNLI